MLTTFFLGDDAVTNDSQPAAPMIDLKGVDTVKLASLAKLMNAAPGALAPLDPAATTHWVIAIAPAFTTALAKLPNATAIAKQWLATPEWRADQGTAESVGDALTGLVVLAGRAARDRKTMYVRITP